MKYPRRSYAFLIGALLMLPALSFAASEHDAVAACARALTNAIAEKQGGAPVKFRLDDASDLSSRRVKETLRYHVSATDLHGNEIVARANCIVDTRARVRQFTALPLDRDARTAL